MTTFQVQIEHRNGFKLAIEIKSASSVSQLKELYCDAEGVSPSQQQISFNGQILSDEKTFSELGVVSGSLLKMIFVGQSDSEDD